ncbi:MAG: DUF3857 domain-containing protein [Bacteroidales bacterium]|nr:DUF3857 domain-containing protein [Bacteroidales bacterium]MBN2821124.1 DUF3857 domain-containing protein [Bacteroidales bacterium]
MKQIKPFIILTCIVFASVLNATPNEDAIVNYNNLSCTIENGKLIKSYSLSITIYNRRGEDNTRFVIPFEGNQKILNLNAYITDINGNIIQKLKKKEITTSNAFSYGSLYEDNYVSRFVLRNNYYPYTIYVSYEIEYDEFFYIADWTPEYNYNYKTLNSTLELTIPKDYKINFHQVNVNDPTILEDAGSNTIKYTWNAEYSEVFMSEIYCPEIEELVPVVQVVPINFKYEINGTQSSWDDYGKWKIDLTQNLLDLPANEKVKINLIIDSIDDRTEKIRKLYEYLQENTRYINISLGTGGLKPYPANYVAYNKYGDCKALSNYMKALLNYAGISSSFAYVNSGKEKCTINKEFPSQQFNHVLLAVPNAEDTIWLECTNKNYPAGYFGTSTQNHEVLLVGDSEIALTKIPALDSVDVLNSSNISVILSISGRDKYKMKNKYRGAKYEALTSIKNLTDKKFQENLIFEIIPLNDILIENWEIENTHSDSACMQVISEFTSSSTLKKYGEEYLLKPHGIYIPDFEKPEKRKLPVRINYPIVNFDTISYTIPFGHQISHAPENIEIDSEYGTYSYSVDYMDDKVIISRSITLNCGEYPLSLYPHFYNFIEQVRISEAKNSFLIK